MKYQRIILLFFGIWCASCTKELARPSLNTTVLQLPFGVTISKLALDPSGNIYALGNKLNASPFLPASANASWLAKLDPNGTIIWEKNIFDAPSQAIDMFLTEQNELIITVMKNYFLPGPRVNLSITRNVFLKFDANGNKRASRIFPDTTSRDADQIYYANWFQNKLLAAYYNPNSFQIERFTCFDDQFNTLEDTIIELSGFNAAYSGPNLIMQGLPDVGNANFISVRYEGNQFVKRNFAFTIDSLNDWEFTVSAQNLVFATGENEQVVTDLFLVKGNQVKNFLIGASPGKAQYWVKPLEGKTIYGCFSKENRIHLYYSNQESEFKSEILEASNGTPIPFNTTMPNLGILYSFLPIGNNKTMGLGISNRIYIWNEILL